MTDSSLTTTFATLIDRLLLEDFIKGLGQSASLSSVGSGNPRKIGTATCIFADAACKDNGFLLPGTSFLAVRVIPGSDARFPAHLSSGFGIHATAADNTRLISPLTDPEHLDVKIDGISREDGETLPFSAFQKGKGVLGDFAMTIAEIRLGRTPDLSNRFLLKPAQG